MRNTSSNKWVIKICWVWFCYLLLIANSFSLQGEVKVSDSALEAIRIGKDGITFVRGENGDPFFVWGCNYDHDSSGRLIEDYWVKEWNTVVQDFDEMKNLGVNVVRIHLQLGKFLNSPKEMNPTSMQKLKDLVDLAEDKQLYLNLTGLGCYHKKDIPKWYDDLDEDARWKVQAFFWTNIARECKESIAIFCYDLMNEPVLPGKNKIEKEWLLGELGGKYFVQRIALDLNERSRIEAAKDWVDMLVGAIRKEDKNNLITVGVIPWALTFPKAKPLFYSPEVSENLDFVSVHFYPQKGEIDKALTALKVYEIGKPLVIEEMFPLKCSLKEMDAFINQSATIVDGWLSFYWGKTVTEYREEKANLPSNIIASWLEYLQEKRHHITDPNRSE